MARGLHLRSMSTVDQLIAAAGRGDVPAMRAILPQAPELRDARNMIGAGAIHAAHFAGQSAAVAYLDGAGLVRDPWLRAELGDLAGVRAALDSAPELVHAFNAGGSTLLHAAAYWGQVDVAKLLVERGADVNAVTRDSFLHIHPLGSGVASPGVEGCPAESEDNVLAIATLLLDAGAGVNNRRRDGLTALHTAGYRGHDRVARLLLERGADRSIRGHDSGGAHGGQSAAEMAEERGHLDTARLIRAAGG